MKFPLLVALSLFSACALANANAEVAEPLPPAVEYDYSQHLDVARIISMTSASDTSTACGPVQAHMVYVDSKGVTHNMAYTRLGDGCQNG